jgi:hypothetical protein
MKSVRYSCQILMNLEFSRYIVEKYSNIKFHENPCSGSRVVPRGQTDGQTDMSNLTVAFRNFANALKNCVLLQYENENMWPTIIRLILVLKKLVEKEGMWISDGSWLGGKV